MCVGCVQRREGKGLRGSSVGRVECSEVCLPLAARSKWQELEIGGGFHESGLVHSVGRCHQWGLGEGQRKD